MLELNAIKPGAQVYGRHGAYIGDVQAANDECVRIRVAGPFERILYVPRSEFIGTLPGGELFLSCMRPDLDDMHWQRPPHGLEDDKVDYEPMVGHRHGQGPAIARH